MSYVNVRVNRPTDGPLTYRLTPSTLVDASPGALVEVKLGPRREFAVVTERLKRVSAELKSKIRPIQRVLSPGVWAPPPTLRLAEAMSQYSGESVGVCLFRLLPPAGKRSLHAVRPPSPLSRGQRLHVFGGHADRLEQYIQLIAKAQTSNHQTILMAPLVKHTCLQERFLSLGYRVKCVSAELSATKQRQIAHDLSSGLVDVLIGTRHIVGWPAHQLGILIVDQPYHQSHSDDQRPYLDAGTIAVLRHHAEGGHCVFGTSTYTPALYLAEQRNQAHALARTPPKTSLRIIESPQRGLFAPTLLSEIRSALANNQEVALIAPRRGVGGQYLCQRCRTPATCTVCHSDLEPSGTSLTCSACDTTYDTPQTCSDCGAAHFTYRGIGALSLRRWLRETEPDLLTDQLTIGTEHLLDEPKQRNLVAFTHAHSPLASPSLDRVIHYLSALAEAQCSSHATRIQTNYPDDPWLRSLTNPHTMQTILAERQHHRLPPWRRIIRAHGALTRQSALERLPAEYEVLSQQIHDDQIWVEILCPDGEYIAHKTTVNSTLGRGWTVSCDSVIEHAEPLHGRMPTYAR